MLDCDEYWERLSRNWNESVGYVIRFESKAFLVVREGREADHSTDEPCIAGNESLPRA